MPLFKDDQILIFAPGSQTTLAQLGIPESLTPAQLRIRSRMFRGEQPDKWEPFKVREREPSAANGAKQEDADANGAQSNETEYYEDQETEEGAVWPIKQGRIVDWGCFFALFEYVYSRLSPGLHTPICMVGQACWTVKDQQKITQYIFEKFRPPAFNIVDAALCSLYAHSNTPNACVVDIGYEKADVTAIVDYNIHVAGRQIAVPDCGGDAFTERLFELLKNKKWTREMCEQLKKSPICEILPPGVPLPGTAEAAQQETASANPAAAASTGAIGLGPGNRDGVGVLGEPALGSGAGTQVGDEQKENGEDEGVLDIAKIVGTGNTKDFIAQKEKEKSEKQAIKKGQKQDAAAQAQQAKTAKMLNRDRVTASFIYSDYAFLDAIKNKNMSADEMARAHAAVDEGAKQTQAEKQAAAEQAGDAMDTDAPKAGISSLIHTKAPRREIEVGVERFQAASGGVVDRIADTIHRTISSVNEVAKRSELWDNLIVVGNGAKIRGFREALLSTIQSRYIISPSSATIFTSELPSNLTTPMGTGAQTPQPGQGPSHPPLGPSGGGNPLLLAATTQHLNPHAIAQQQHLGTSTPGGPGSSTGGAGNVHSSHGQTPTSVKYARVGDYFPEWKEVGYNEAYFLGAQVLCRVIFVTDAAQTKCFMTRTDYNELGPNGIGEFAL
ncbi:uncharacterized protein PV09_01021 [Verruconis gallopava]|uniref:Actin-like ATPase domain-containing protein n=1 Tax=Verruconis gallopava TaxID=253628 RepID=A0A0D1XZ61_9PEZI|nr:uncharacterized protein PV09_01021 [Verruconis gallopava]KIW08081.1 hypothetical protein PV09_01021 [Verruconis gallopava]